VSAAALEVRGLHVAYGGIEAVHGIDFDVNAGEIVCILGANGAGKTSTLLAISGVIRPKAGSILFEGQQLTKIPGHRIAGMGIAHVPEGRRVFPRMTVWENLQMGVYAARREPSVSDVARVFELFPLLRDRRTQVAGTLSGGEQQMLAIGRALISRPRLMLLDEPSMGLAPVLVKNIFGLLQSINRDGLTMVIVEQNARMALSLATRAYVMETGSIVLHGESAALAIDPRVRTAYLGGSPRNSDARVNE
jgi:branched-chain amino acid transport system ATP-binding protein